MPCMWRVAHQVSRSGGSDDGCRYCVKPYFTQSGPLESFEFNVVRGSLQGISKKSGGKQRKSYPCCHPENYGQQQKRYEYPSYPFHCSEVIGRSGSFLLPAALNLHPGSCRESGVNFLKHHFAHYIKPKVVLCGYLGIFSSALVVDS